MYIFFWFTSSVAIQTVGNRSDESINSNMSIDFENVLDENASETTESHNNSQNVDANVDIEYELTMFEPDEMAPKQDIISYWSVQKNKHKHLYELAKCIYSIPPTEVDIERDFSLLNFVFTNRRANLSEEHLNEVMRIHLNKDLFFVVKEEELLKLKP